MMRLAIVSFPILEEADREWIESVRARHDPQAARIGVHFTLVFPAVASPLEVAAEAWAVARSAQPIRFRIRCATSVDDVAGGGGHVFLVPDEGGAEIAALHDQLYRGVLRQHLRADIPFTPHMTVAAGPDVERGERLAQHLFLDRPTVHGVLRSIDLVGVEKDRVASIATFVLGASGGTGG